LTAILFFESSFVLDDEHPNKNEIIRIRVIIDRCFMILLALY